MSSVQRLGDLIEINSRSITQTYPHTDILYLDTSSVTEGKIDAKSRLVLADAPSRAKRILKTNDIVISTVRPNLKHYAYISIAEPNLIGSTGFAVITSQGIYPKYLYYWLTQSRVTTYLAAVADASTSTFPAFNPSVIENMQIDLPSEEEQRRIGDMLFALDDKIELNRQMNETIELLGHALFQQYFIDNPEIEEWENGRVADTVEIYSGFAFKRANFDPSGKYGLVTIKNVQDGIFVSAISDRIADVQAKLPSYIHLETGDILLSLTGNVGRVCIVIGRNLLLNQRVAKLLGPEGKHSYAYFLFRQREFKNKLISISRGTAQLNLSPVDVKNIKMKLPPKKVLANFEEIAEPIYKILTANYVEIQNLTALREVLLTGLISGNFKV